MKTRITSFQSTRVRHVMGVKSIPERHESHPNLTSRSRVCNFWKSMQNPAKELFLGVLRRMRPCTIKGVGFLGIWYGFSRVSHLGVQPANPILLKRNSANLYFFAIPEFCYLWSSFLNFIWFVVIDDYCIFFLDLSNMTNTFINNFKNNMVIKMIHDKVITFMKRL